MVIGGGFALSSWDQSPPRIQLDLTQLSHRRICAYATMGNVVIIMGIENGKTIFLSIAASVIACGVVASISIQKIKSDANARNEEANSKIEQLSTTLSDISAPDGCKRKDLYVDIINGSFGPSRNITPEYLSKALPCTRDDRKWIKSDDKDTPQKISAESSYYKDIDVEFFTYISAIRLGENFSGDIFETNNNGTKISKKTVDDLRPLLEKLNYREKLEVKATESHPYATKLYRTNYGCLILTVDRAKKIKELTVTNRECGIETDRGTFTDGNGFHGDSRLIISKVDTENGEANHDKK